MNQNTNSSQNVSRSLTGAERQDLYNNAIGSINNTMRQSGGGGGSSTPARFTGTSGSPGAGGPSVTPWAGGPVGGGDMFPVGSIQQTNNGANAGGGGGGGTFTASGGSDVTGRTGSDGVSWDSTLPILGLSTTNDPTVNMPTGTPDQGGMPFPTWITPTYQSPGQAQQLSNGDYNALQTRMLTGYSSGLDSEKAVDKTNKNADLAARGIWSTGLADKAMTDIDRAYAPAYANAGANAANAAASLQVQQNRDTNTYNTTNAQNANNFNMTNAQNRFTSGWAPLEYLRKLWDGTSGSTSGSSSAGQGFGIMSMGGGGGV